MLVKMLKNPPHHADIVPMGNGSDSQDHATRASFPGGRVKLPSLSVPSTSQPAVDYVTTAFSHAPTVTESEQPATGFDHYFSYESLFEEVELTEDEKLATLDPYEVLGLRSDATWEEIVAAHRKLVKKYHPDRFVGQPQDAIEAAQAQFRSITKAYLDLKQRRGK